MIHEIKDLKIFHSSYLALLGFDQKQHVEVKKYSVKEKFVKSQQRKKSSNHNGSIGYNFNLISGHDGMRFVKKQ